jgi:hypothetical protein
MNFKTSRTFVVHVIDFVTYTKKKKRDNNSFLWNDVILSMYVLYNEVLRQIPYVKW